jgi:cytosine deaminase
MDFRTMPEGGVTLSNVTVPACLLGQEGDLIRTDISIADGRIADRRRRSPSTWAARWSFRPSSTCTPISTRAISGRAAPIPTAPSRARSPPSAPTAPPAGAPRTCARACPFSLRSAYAHGTRAIRTHLDSIPPQDDITWPVFRELQADWADRIDLQAVCLIGCDKWTDDDGPSAIPPIWWRKPRAASWAWSPTPCPTCATG